MASAADTITLSASFAKTCRACFSRSASRLAVSLASTRCLPTCAKVMPEVNHSTSINIDFIFCMSPSPPGGKALDALSLYPLRYNLKSTLRQGTFCKGSANIRMLIGRGDLECPYARTNDFRGGATSWAPSIGDSVLRENWTPSPGPANERAKTIRHYSSLPAGNRSACASTRVYIE